MLKEYTLFYGANAAKTHLFTRARKTRHDNIYDLLTHTPFWMCYDKKHWAKRVNTTHHFKRGAKQKEEEENELLTTIDLCSRLQCAI